MVATWGAISWRGDRARRQQRRSCSRAPATPKTPDDTWSAWSARVHAVRRRADHQPEGALPAVARGPDRQRRGAPVAHVGDRRLSAAQPAAARCASITVHPPGIVFQKPFSTGDPELAGFDDQTTPDRSSQAAQRERSHGSPAARRRSAAARIRRGCRRSSGGPTTRTTTTCCTTCCTGAKARPTWKPLKRGADRIRSSSGTRRRCRTAPTS